MFIHKFLRNCPGVHRHIKLHGILWIFTLSILAPTISAAQKIFTENSKPLPHSNNYINYAPVSAEFTMDNHLPYPIFSPDPENSNLQKPKVNWIGFTLTTAALTGTYIALFNHEQSRRWDAPTLPFYFNSRFETRGIDKAGHFYAAKAQASLISNLYTLSNVNRKTSALLGAGIALSVQSLIEINDGRISGGGFDLYDQTANVLGVTWFYAREKSNFLRRFDIRWFYYPSEDRERLPTDARFTEDYNGNTYWLGIRMGDLIPHWPRFILPAAGVSLNKWSVHGEEGYLSYHLSLNPDFRHIFPQQTSFGRTLTDFFNSFYIPAPAVEIYPDVGFKLIFYGRR